MARNANTNRRGSTRGQSNKLQSPSLTGRNPKKGGATGSRKATRRGSQG